MRRWLALALTPAALVVLYLPGMLAAELSAGADTVVHAVLVTLEIVGAVALGIRAKRRTPLPPLAGRLLPLGIAAGQLLWLGPTAVPALRDPDATVRGIGREITLSTMVLSTVVVIGVWSLAAMALGMVLPAVATRARWLGASAAAIMGVLLVVALGYLAIRLPVGAAGAPLSTFLAWAPAILLNDNVGLPVSGSFGAEVAGFTSTLIVLCTAYYLGYLLGSTRPQPATAPSAVPEPV